MTASDGGRESGQVAGLEGLVFGVLLFVFGVLLVVNGWAVVDARLAAAAAAREATRTFVESSGDGTAAEQTAVAAGMRAFAGYGRSPVRGSVDRVAGRLARCAEVVFEARYELPALHVPVVGGLGSGWVVRARHAEVVDPHRSGVATGVGCGGG